MKSAQQKLEAYMSEIIRNYVNTHSSAECNQLEKKLDNLVRKARARKKAKAKDLDRANPKCYGTGSFNITGCGCKEIAETVKGGLNGSSEVGSTSKSVQV